MAIYDSKFISTAYLKAETPIQENVEDNILIPYIKLSQSVHIQQALGSHYYNFLMEAVATKSLTVKDKDLLINYIQPALAQFTFYEVLPHLNFKITNKAISQQNSEFSNPSGVTEVKYLRNSVRDLAEFLLKRLQNELNGCKSDYPEYKRDADQNVKPNGSSYFSGIYLGE